jgi:6-pyruvoyltetrahydropterin/6-carboxytetrahydropterin synthase
VTGDPGHQHVGAAFFVSKQVEFDAGHRVPLHGSKCRSPHGHRYVVKATCVGSPVAGRAADEGMVVDFADLKEWMMAEVSGPLDHSFMVFNGDLPMRRALEEGAALDDEAAEDKWRVVCLPVVPTAENLAKWCFDRLKLVVDEHWRRNVALYEVEVWETPTSMARYRPWGQAK